MEMFQQQQITTVMDEQMWQYFAPQAERGICYVRQLV
jgi:hypothetical protein